MGVEALSLLKRDWSSLMCDGFWVVVVVVVGAVVGDGAGAVDDDDGDDGVMPKPGTEMPAAPRRLTADWLT